MAALPNLSGFPRFAYVFLGLAALVWGFFGASSPTGRLVWPILGAVVLVEGLIGFCPVVALFGRGSKPK